MKKLMIEAPIMTSSGYGEHARLVLRSLREDTSLDIYINPVNWGSTSWSLESGPERDYINSLVKKTAEQFQNVPQEEWHNIFDIFVHVGIPNEFQKKGRYCVSVTAGIETNKVSSNWLIKTHQGIDKMIVPSEHSKSGFLNTMYKAVDQNTNKEVDLTINCPISVVPYPVKTFDPIDPIIDLDYDFNFLCVALWGPRKNLENLMKWFVSEFRDEEVGLVIKTGISKTGKMDRIAIHKKISSFTKTLGERKCKIYLLHGSLTDEEMNSLYHHPKIKAYATTTHGEGYGLPIFEAAYSGLPVVATDWSGHLDFLTGTFNENNKLKVKRLFARVDYEMKKISERVVWQDILVEDSMWAHPKEASFRKQIRSVYKNHGMYKKWASALMQQLLDTNSQPQVLEDMRKEILGPLELNLNFGDETGEDVIVL